MNKEEEKGFMYLFKILHQKVYKHFILNRREISFVFFRINTHKNEEFKRTNTNT